MTIKDAISKRIANGPDGHVWTADDFADLAGRDAVDKVLQRLVADGTLTRLQRGLYHRSRVNALTGEPFRPVPLAVIEALKRRDKLRMLVDGMTAANDLGLTTAVPARTIVHTDGRRKSIDLGGLVIEFRLTAPSKLVWADRPAMRLVQALAWLHDQEAGIDKATTRRVLALLLDGKEGRKIAQDLSAGLADLPASWMREYLRPILQQVGGKRGQA